MKEIYKETFIYKICSILEINIKELALIMNKTHKIIEFWRKNDDNIPAKELEYMKLLIKNKQLENEIFRLQKHKVILNTIIKADLDGEIYIDTPVKGLKKLTSYKIIIEEL